MNCAEFETLLADYVDGTLAASDRSAVDEHVLSCSACREFMAEVTGAVSFLKRVEDVVPPSELVTRIAYQAPLGRIREPFEHQGFLSKLITRYLQPILQPRLAMSMALTILSFAMLERCTGIRVQHIQAADLNPIRVWDNVEDRAIRVKDRAVKYYENIRLVYEIESRFKEFQDQQPASSSQDSQDKNGESQKSPANRDSQQ